MLPHRADCARSGGAGWRDCQRGATSGLSRCGVPLGAPMPVQCGPPIVTLWGSRHQMRVRVCTLCRSGAPAEQGRETASPCCEARVRPAGQSLRVHGPHTFVEKKPCRHARSLLCQMLALGEMGGLVEVLREHPATGGPEGTPEGVMQNAGVASAGCAAGTVASSAQIQPHPGDASGECTAGAARPAHTLTEWCAKRGSLFRRQWPAESFGEGTKHGLCTEMLPCGEQVCGTVGHGFAEIGFTDITQAGHAAIVSDGCAGEGVESRFVTGVFVRGCFRRGGVWSCRHRVFQGSNAFQRCQRRPGRRIILRHGGNGVVRGCPGRGGAVTCHLKSMPWGGHVVRRCLADV